MTFATGAEQLTDDVVASVGVLTDGASTLGRDELVALTRQVARMRSAIDRCALAISRRSSELHDAGAGPDPEDLWGRDGGSSKRDARDQRRRAKACNDTPELGGAVQQGAISTAHLDVVARLLERLDAQLKAAFQALDQEITERAQQLTVDEFEQWCRRRIERLGAALGRARHERQQRETRLRRWVDGATGMYRIAGDFHPELGVRLFASLDAQINEMRAAGDSAVLPGDPLGPLDELMTDREHLGAHALARAVIHRSRSDRPARAEMSVIVDAETLAVGPHDGSVCEYGDGTPLPHDTLRRLACIAELHRVLWSTDGDHVDVGRSTRLANRAQRRALRSRYRTCAWQDCTVAFRHCEVHHLHWWEDGGCTDIDNLVPLCVRHHHHAHELGWTLELSDDRRLVIRQPDGTLYAVTEPPHLRPPGRPPDRPPPGRRPQPPGAGARQNVVMVG